MTITIGIDVGSTYTKSIVLDENGIILAKDARHTGFKLDEVSEVSWRACIDNAGLTESDIDYTVSTGIGRHLCPVKDIFVTDLTASARGASRLFPNTRTILDVGGQTMKAIRLEENAKVKNFRLNDKCAAGTGAFLEKTARYMGYTTEKTLQKFQAYARCSLNPKSSTNFHLALHHLTLCKVQLNHLLSVACNL